MKILLKLDSVHFTDEQNQDLYNNMIESDWDFPILPRSDELFEFDDIVDEDKWPEFYNGFLDWGVDVVKWTKINGTITPILWLRGE